MHKHKPWLLALSVAIVALATFALYRWLAPSALPEGLLYGSGQIEATEVRVTSEVPGRVLESRLVEGGTVQAGDLLVRLDETDLRTRLKQAEAAATAAERTQAQTARELDTARHHLDTARTDLARYRKLRATGDVSAQAIDRAENEYREAQGRVESLIEQQAQAAASREAATREAELVRSQVGKTVIRAPADGTLLTKGFEVGELASPGSIIAIIADLRRAEIKIYIPEREIGKVQIDAPARVRVDAFPQRYFEARVTRVDARAQFTPKDVHTQDERARLVFGVVLAVDNEEGYLKPGMPADGWVRWKPDAAWPEVLPVPR